MNLGILGFPQPFSNINTESSGSGRYLRMVRFTTSGNYVPSSDISFIIVYLLGAGGGGGGANGATTYGPAGGSGAGGGACILKIDASSLSNPEIVTIGSGGNGGSSTGGPGNTGGTTSLGTHCSATGGQGGEYITGSMTVLTSTAQGGVGIGGNDNFRGDPGNPPLANYASYPKSLPGGRGAGPLGGAGARGLLGGGGSGYNGNNADANSGGGGGGGVSIYDNGASKVSGGNGGSGLCIIYEFS